MIEWYLISRKNNGSYSKVGTELTNSFYDIKVGTYVINMNCNVFFHFYICYTYCKAYFEILSSYFNFRNVKKGNSVQDCKNCAMHKRNGFIRASLIYFLFLFFEYCSTSTTKKFIIISSKNSFIKKSYLLTSTSNS